LSFYFSCADCLHEKVEIKLFRLGVVMSLVEKIDLKLLYSMKKYRKVLFLLMIGFSSHCSVASSMNFTMPATITYYLNIADFAYSFIGIPTSNLSGSSTTIASSYLAGRAPLYDAANDIMVGTCSASFLSMQTSDSIFTDISNYISTYSGLIVTWFTPTTLINLELDSIINSMVTECMVTVTTKVGVSPFYGQSYTLTVSSDSDNQRIYFKFARSGMIF